MPEDKVTLKEKQELFQRLYFLQSQIIEEAENISAKYPIIGEECRQGLIDASMIIQNKMKGLMPE